MSIQWTVISVILYVEVVTVLILLLPWIRPTFWRKVFNSRLVHQIKKFSRIYSYAVVFVLLLLFFDATREVRKYSEVDMNLDNRRVADADSIVHMRLFRAQRNLYICGFTLLLFLVIRRITGLLARSANLEDTVDSAFDEEKNELLKQIKNLQATKQNMIEKTKSLQEEYARVSEKIKSQ